MSKVCVIAIDRAKKDAAEACRMLERDFDIDLKAYLLVSESFKASSAYKGDEADGYFEEVVLDFNNIETVEETIKNLIAKFDKVVTHCLVESAMSDYARIIPFLKNTLTQTPQSLELASEKTKMRAAISALYPEISPRFVIIDSFEAFNSNVVKDFDFPVIIKPNGLTASYLVTKCNDMDDLEKNLRQAFDNIQEIYRREHGVGKKSILVEEFIEGEMYSIDAYVDSRGVISYLPPVRVVTSYDVGLSGFYGYERTLPTPISTDDVAEANRCVMKTARALGIINSTIHVELYHTKNGWKTVELGPRIGGYRQELYKEVYGIEHFYNDLRVHFGKEPIIKTVPLKYASAINIYPEKEGKIKKIIGIESAKRLESILTLKKYFEIGDEAKFAINGGKYVVDSILTNTSKEKLAADVIKVRELIHIETEDE